MKQENQNLFLAIGLSILVIVGWNYFYGVPQVQKAREQATQSQGPSAPSPQTSAPATSAPSGQAGLTVPGAPTVAPEVAKTRQEALAATPRVIIDTPKLKGSINLKGARIDDVELKAYRETTDPNSPNIVVFSPSGSPEPYYAEAGFIQSAAPGLAVPPQDALWSADGDKLTAEKPLTLSFDNGAGLLFKRTISVDDQYMFTIADSVENKGSTPASLSPFALIARHYRPKTSGYAVFYEGLLGVIGDSRLQEVTYDGIEKEPRATKSFSGVGGFIGMTDKYWAAAVVPDQQITYKGTFRAFIGNQATPSKEYQTDVLADPLTIAPGATASVTTRVFAGAKVTATIDKYEASLGIKNFDLLIDWGWFYFITKPLFHLIDFLYRIVGNFGLAILITTFLIKLAFFPLANRSYQSMAKMKALQPQIEAVRQRFADDKQKQQQAMMELYKKEKINPVAGCLPMLIQIPVFFALYKVIFVTIEMRQAPFFGWIRDLSAPDPTTVFNLFGLIPFAPPPFLQIGSWPLVMGLTMYLQMKMNPAPTDPVQKTMFAWMPVIFTFMLGTFPAGLVIYWTFNNILSMTQQYFIMKKAGVKVELWDNLIGVFRKKKVSAASP
ncbi:MAG: membrane protein insertase YidC [Methylobacteriaceae bacterium]|nr:membrane protein insertase YidC [Methylobacteriaceae bacterium]